MPGGEEKAGAKLSQQLPRCPHCPQLHQPLCAIVKGRDEHPHSRFGAWIQLGGSITQKHSGVPPVLQLSTCRGAQTVPCTTPLIDKAAVP